MPRPTSKNKEPLSMPAVGELYAVPIADGSFGLVQVAHRVQHSARAYTFTAAFFADRAASIAALRALAETTSLAHPIIVLTPSTAPIRDGEWTRLTQRDATYENVDVTTRLSADYAWFDGQRHPVRWLLNIYHGVYPWDANRDPEYLDKLLVAGTARPKSARMKADFSTDEFRALRIKVV